MNNRGGVLRQSDILVQGPRYFFDKLNTHQKISLHPSNETYGSAESPVCALMFTINRKLVLFLLYAITCQ